MNKLRTPVKTAWQHRYAEEGGQATALSLGLICILSHIPSDLLRIQLRSELLGDNASSCMRVVHLEGSYRPPSVSRSSTLGTWPHRGPCFKLYILTRQVTQAPCALIVPKLCQHCKSDLRFWRKSRWMASHKQRRFYARPRRMYCVSFYVTCISRDLYDVSYRVPPR